MRAMILAAGLGTRLRPLTNTLPKALVPVGGRPMLEYSLDWLANQGVREVLVNVHHFAPLMIEFLHKAAGRWPLRFEIQDESKLLLGSGGGVALARAWLYAHSNSALFWNPDGLIFPDLRELAATHERGLKQGREATICLLRHPEVGKKFHPVYCRGDEVIGFGRDSVKSDGDAYHFAGPYMLSKAAANLLPAAGTVSDIAKEVWFPLVRGHKFGAYFYQGPYQDLGQFADIAEAEARIARGDFAAYGIQ